jgi:hypothetical protein
MSNAFAALIWWVVPAAGLIGAFGYVLWVTKFEGKFQQETQRSVGQFQRFQDSLRDSQASDAAGGIAIITSATVADSNGKSSDDAISADPSTLDAGFDSGFDAGSSN